MKTSKKLEPNQLPPGLGESHDVDRVQGPVFVWMRADRPVGPVERWTDDLDMDFPALMNTLVVGSYLFGAAVWWFMWRELKSLKAEFINLRLQLAEDRGIQQGRDYESRISRLERKTRGQSDPDL